jgi:aspartyl-tRNA(Asn)/glutamyl-tRNA(Gln) amidotransferase subunit C
MSKLSEEEIKHVANLAKLSLTKQEVSKYRTQLSEVLTHFEQLNEVDTKDVEPTHQTTNLENVTRKDEITEKTRLTKKQALSGTDKVKNGYFVVPGLLEERSDK